MKRIILGATAAALLVSCDTNPGGDPYGVPYPPQDPYGAPMPYPPYPSEPYPPPAPIPPGGVYPPAEAADACPIISSRDWQAWIDERAGTGGRPTLFLTGKVVTPAGGHRVEFIPNLEERRSYPVQLVARMWVLPPTGGAVSQGMETHELRWEWPLSSGPVGSLTIYCGDRTIAEVRPASRTQ